MKKKIILIFGTRPEVIKLFPVIKSLRQEETFAPIIISTSQHREMIDDLLKLFEIKPDYDLNIIQENQSLGDISMRALSGLDPILKREKPDLVLVQGDTTTAFIGGLAAFYNKIPVGHVEAGLRSWDDMNPYPEEVNRRLLSVLSRLHFAPTVGNAENLYREGIEKGKVFVTGNTVIDTLLHTAKREKGTLNKYLPEETLNSHRLILVTAHRRENWGEPLENMCHALKHLTRSFHDIQIVYPVHLNPNVRETVFKILTNEERIHLIAPLSYESFVEAMTRAYLIITDSGGIQEEAPSLGKPVLVFRKVTERPEGLLTGGVKLIGLEKESVFQEASCLLQDSAAYQSMIADHNPYGDGHAADRIIQVVRYAFNMGSRPEGFNPTRRTNATDLA